MTDMMRKSRDVTPEQVMTLNSQLSEVGRLVSQLELLSEKLTQAANEVAGTMNGFGGKEQHAERS